MDTSSEIVHALLPIYLVSVLGASMLDVGFIEGIAEATASITKVFSGALSDWLGKRKSLAVVGYGLAALSKPIFPLATSISWLVAARFIDRLGKGIRGAPRDAMIADMAPADLRGASFGLAQSLDTIGAFVGPALAIGLMWVTANNFQTTFWFAVIPAFLCVMLLVFGVHEPPRPRGLRQVRSPLSFDELWGLGQDYWWVVGVAVVFSIARFSEAFLILRAQAEGLPLMFTPLVLVLMNVAYAFSAYPAGALSDRVNRTSILAVGFGFLMAADLVFAFIGRLSSTAFGVVLWGLHMGFTQGLLASLVADTSPTELRGTAFGVFNLLTGAAALVASVLAGALWDHSGSQATFLASAILTAVALVALAAVRHVAPHVGRVSKA